MTNKWILPSSFTIALGVSFVLFAFMASLVKKPQSTDIPIDLPSPDVFTNYKELSQQELKPPAKTLPPKPDKAPPPQQQTVDIKQATETTSSSPKFDITSIDQGISVGTGQYTVNKPTLGEGNSNSDARAIVQIPPQYPMEAAQKGIEGWVKLSFSINTDGSVTNIEIVDSEPKRIFDRAAKKALKGWRYKAKFVDAVPVMQHNLMIQLDFELEK